MHHFGISIGVFVLVVFLIIALIFIFNSDKKS